MNAIYKDRVDFRVVYVREAHPEDGWQVPANTRSGVVYKEPKTTDERAEVASACAAGLKITIPILLDGMDNKVEAAYGGWPDRIYVIGKDGKVAYQGRPGPAGFKPAEAEDALKAIL